jgi:CubicO group peptidase (beta-lactamase class C family)
MTETKLAPGIEGICDERFSRIAHILSEQLSRGDHNGVAACIYHRGAPVVDVWGGAFRRDTMAVSFSTTKGPAAVALHMAMERNGVSYDAPVASVWPEFGRGARGAQRAGPPTWKDGILIRHALCHEAGVPQIRGEIPSIEATSDWDEMVAMMERLEPLWEPGTANGYHAVNYGWLVGELVRRIDGRDISSFLAEEITGPLQLDGCYIGTPDSEHGRIAPLIQAPIPEGAPSLEEFMPEGSIAWRALGPDGDIVAFVNSPQGMSTCGPAFSGAFTARSLARLYACLERGGELDGVRLLTPDTITTATTVQNTRPDLVLVLPINWRLGFMSGGSPISPAGPNPEAYGHAGYGGSIGLADPKAEIAMAITLDRLEVNLLGGDRITSVVNAAVEAAAR